MSLNPFNPVWSFKVPSSYKLYACSTTLLTLSVSDKDPERLKSFDFWSKRTLNPSNSFWLQKSADCYQTCNILHQYSFLEPSRLDWSWSPFEQCSSVTRAYRVSPPYGHAQFCSISIARMSSSCYGLSAAATVYFVWSPSSWSWPDSNTNSSIFASVTGIWSW